MANIYIGTSGYSYKDWIGPFYPAKTKQQDFLKRYGHEFNAVELNFIYYRQPEAKIIAGMVDATPENFLFTYLPKKPSLNLHWYSYPGKFWPAGKKFPGQVYSRKNLLL
jgi:hypothetical protein